MKSRRFIIILLATVLLAFVMYLLKSTVLAPEDKNSSTETTQLTPTQSSGFDKSQFSLDDPASLWVVVNKQRPLSPINYRPADLVQLGGGQTLRAAAGEALIALYNDAKAAGFNLVTESSYRSFDIQQSVYNNEVRTYGQATADTQSARPGHSEHQTGWAVDIGLAGCFEDCFGKTSAAKWVAENSHKYGFILRYPPDKTHITGYRSEPWHYRFVGLELAGEVSKTGMTLEEIFGLPAAPNY